MTMRIAIVNDREASRDLLRLAVETSWQLAWEAQNGAQAIKLCAQDTPDLILMSLRLPDMSGTEITRKIMAASPCAILVVTAGVNENTSLVFDALAAGALDAVDTPEAASGHSALIAKIRTIARLVAPGRQPRTALPVSATPDNKLPTLVAVGSSTGGPAALRILLEQLPADFPAAIVIVQHLDEKFSLGMAEWLASVTTLPVSVAKAGQRPEAGHVLLAGTNDHLVLQENGSLQYVPEPTEQPYRPSVDEFYGSAALYWKGPLIGVLLTGMGQDGARGLLALRRLGHVTLAQDQQSSVVYGMPGAAARFGAAMLQMDPAGIGRELVKIISAPPVRRLQAGSKS